MKRMFCDSCDTVIENVTSITQETAHLPGVNVGIEVRSFTPDTSDLTERDKQPELCAGCFTEAAAQVLGIQSIRVEIIKKLILVLRRGDSTVDAQELASRLEGVIR